MSDEDYDFNKLISAINRVKNVRKKPTKLFGLGGSALKFYNILRNNNSIWSQNTQKYFKDYF